MDHHIRLRLEVSDAAPALVLSKNGDAALLYAFCLAQGGLGDADRAMEALGFDRDRLQKAYEVLRLYGIAESGAKPPREEHQYTPEQLIAAKNSDPGVFQFFHSRFAQQKFSSGVRVHGCLPSIV